jgi:hypothetical protein
MRTLAEDGRRLVEAGVTTIEEVLSVTTVHEFAPSPSTITNSQIDTKSGPGSSTRVAG